MRAASVLLAVAAALAGGEPPWIAPPADPAAGPLPAGLTTSLRCPQRWELGTPLRIALVVAAGAAPVAVLGGAGDITVDLSRHDADGTVRRQPAGARWVMAGMTRLPAGGSIEVPVHLSWVVEPMAPGRCRFSAFADLGWGPERPADPRRAEAEMECVWPAAARIPALVERGLAPDRNDGTRVDLSHAPFVGELRRHAAGGSLRALEQLGSAPGREAAEALLAIAAAPPAAWHDHVGDAPPNLGFSLLHRLADHLPPRRLPGEEEWWSGPEAWWRRNCQDGVPRALLPQARAAGLAWLEREPWGAAEVLVWSAQAEDRPALAAAIARLAAQPDADSRLHTIWRLAYAMLLADPAAPPAEGGLAGDAMWAVGRAVAGGAGSAADLDRLRAMLAAPDPLVRRLAVWSVPHPVPPPLVPGLVQALAEAGPAGDDLLWKLRDVDDPRVLDAQVAALADPQRSRFLDAERLAVLAPRRRVEAALAVVARTRVDGRGDDALRAIAGLCLSVRPVLAMDGWPDTDGWRRRCDAWERWLRHHQDRLRHGPIPAGDPAQPDHWLGPRWWFEAADGRRWFAPPPGA